MICTTSISVNPAEQLSLQSSQQQQQQQQQQHKNETGTTIYIYIYIYRHIYSTLLYSAIYDSIPLHSIRSTYMHTGPIEHRAVHTLPYINALTLHAWVGIPVRRQCKYQSMHSCVTYCMYVEYSSWLHSCETAIQPSIQVKSSQVKSSQLNQTQSDSIRFGSNSNQFNSIRSSLGHARWVGRYIYPKPIRPFILLKITLSNSYIMHACICIIIFMHRRYDVESMSTCAYIYL